MLIQHVIDRTDEGTIRQAFQKRLQDRCESAIGILNFLELLEEQPFSTPLWAFEGHSHLVLSVASKAGHPYVSVCYTMEGTYTVYATVRRPIAGIKKAGDVYFRDLNKRDAVDITIKLLNKKLSDDLDRGVRAELPKSPLESPPEPPSAT